MPPEVLMTQPPVQQPAVPTDPRDLPVDPGVHTTYDVLVGVAWTLASVAGAVLVTMFLIWLNSSVDVYSRVWPVSLWAAVVGPLTAAAGLGITANHVVRRATARAAIPSEPGPDTVARE
jgi:hypothetical protein